MARMRGVDVEKEILDLLGKSDKPMSMRDLQNGLGRQWYSVWRHIKGKEDNLEAAGCVRPIESHGPQKSYAQDEHKYRITEKGRRGCPRD